MANIAIFGYYGQRNIGDEAILSSLLTGIRGKVHEANITVFSADTDYTKELHGVAAQRSVMPVTLKRVVMASLGNRRRSFYKALHAAFRTDVVVVGGGGLLVDGLTSNEHLLELLNFINMLKKRFHKRVCLIGVSAGPIFHKTSERALRAALSGLDAITVRDQESKKLLQGFGIDAPPVMVAPDLAFDLTASEPSVIDGIMLSESLGQSGRPVVAVTPCSYNHFRSGWIDAYVEFCVHAVDHLAAELWLIPMQTSVRNDDRSSTREIARKVGRSRFVKCIEGSYGPRDILGLIGRADAVLAERFHGAIFGVNAATPVLGIGYMPKVTRLFEEMGRPEWCMDIGKLDSRTLIAEFERVFSERQKIAEELSGFSDRCRLLAKEHYDVVSRIVNLG